MRLSPLPLLALFAFATPALGAIQFLGHGVNATGVVARGDWSSDLGPPWIASRPIADLTHGTVIEADTIRALSGGPAFALSRVTIAPAGPANGSAPVLVYEGQVSAQNNGNLYGRTAASQHSACVRFTPPGSGATVHYAVRWRSTGNATGGTMHSYTVATPFQQIATQSSPDSGVYYGTVPGTSSGLCSFNFFLDGGVSSSALGTIDRSLRVEVYLDSSPIADAEPLAEQPLRLLAPRPNPSRGPTAFAWTLAEPADTRLVVTDVAGRTVRELARGPRAAGLATATWDGRDARGERLPAGLYFARLTVERGGRSSTHQQSVVLLP